MLPGSDASTTVAESIGAPCVGKPIAPGGKMVPCKGEQCDIAVANTDGASAAPVTLPDVGGGPLTRHDASISTANAALVTRGRSANRACTAAVVIEAAMRKRPGQYLKSPGWGAFMRSRYTRA